MPRGFYGRGRGFGGVGRGMGNPYPMCRFYPWLPRGWWRYGASPYDTYPGYEAPTEPWGYAPPPYGAQPGYPYPYRRNR